MSRLYPNKKDIPRSNKERGFFTLTKNAYFHFGHKFQQKTKLYLLSQAGNG